MSDPNWPNEPFTAKHDASGTPVKVTPVDMGEPDLLPQSMRVGKGEPQDLHWTELDEQMMNEIASRLLFGRPIRGPGFPTIDATHALLKRIEALEDRLAKLETPQPPEGT